MNCRLACLLVITFCYFYDSQLRAVSGARLVRTRHKRDTTTCVQRCNRIFERSLRRIGESRETLQTLLDKQRPRQQAKDACWKSFDYLDCMHHCELPDRYQLAKASRSLKSRCRLLTEGEESQLECISRFHSFLEVRCSTYLNEAMRLSKLGIRMKHETCRYLHYHNLCLANNIFHFCPKANRIFTRLNLRDYFISFVLPEDDQYFSEEYLDDCQIYDFVKAARSGYDSTQIDDTDSTTQYFERNEDGRVTRVTHPDQQLDDTYVTTSATTSGTPLSQRASTTATKSSETVTPTTTTKILFSPDRDLQFTPPNFFYSSIRSSSRRKTTLGDLYSHDTSNENDLDVVTLPVQVLTHQLGDHSREENEQRSREIFYTTPLPRVFATYSTSREIWSPTIPRQPSIAIDSESSTSARDTEITEKRVKFDDVFNHWNSLNLATRTPNLSSTLFEPSSWPRRVSSTVSRQLTRAPTSSDEDREVAANVQRPKQGPHQKHHTTTHRTVADELSDVYTSVAAITPHPATVSPKGDIYADLSYESDGSDDNEKSSETRTHLHTKTYEASHVPLEYAHNSLLPHLHPTLITQFTTIPSTITKSGDMVYLHKADAQLMHTSLSAKNLTTTAPMTSSDTSTRSNRINRVRVTGQPQHYQSSPLNTATTERRQRLTASTNSSESRLDTHPARYTSGGLPQHAHHSNTLSSIGTSKAGEAGNDYYASVAKPSTSDSEYAHQNSQLQRIETTDNPRQLTTTDMKMMPAQHSSTEEKLFTTSKSRHMDLTKRPPMFLGQRIHVKPIRRWKEPISDENSERSSHDSFYNGEPLRKRTKTSATGVHEPKPIERNRWNLISKMAQNQHRNGDAEILDSDYDDHLNLPDVRFGANDDVLDESIISEIENGTEDGRGVTGFVDLLPTDHSAIMLFIYATLVSVALLTVVALSAALALRRYFI